MITLNIENWSDFTPDIARTISELLTEKDELWDDIVGR